MNEILYADSDTNHFKVISDKVWILAPKPITQPLGTAKQVSLSRALQSAVRFHHTPLKTTRRTIRFIRARRPQPKMVQTTAHVSQPSSLSKALKKAILIKNGICPKKIGIIKIEGTTVWSITPKRSFTEKSCRSSSFLSGLHRLPPKKPIYRVIETAPPTEDKLFSVPASVCNSPQVMSSIV